MPQSSFAFIGINPGAVETAVLNFTIGYIELIPAEELRQVVNCSAVHLNPLLKVERGVIKFSRRFGEDCHSAITVELSTTVVESGTVSVEMDSLMTTGTEADQIVFGVVSQPAS